MYLELGLSLCPLTSQEGWIGSAFPKSCRVSGPFANAQSWAPHPVLGVVRGVWWEAGIPTGCQSWIAALGPSFPALTAFLLKGGPSGRLGSPGAGVWEWEGLVL